MLHRTTAAVIAGALLSSALAPVPAAAVEGTAVLIVPNDLVVEATGSTGAIVTYPAAVDPGADGTLICLPASGAAYPVGTTTVTCSSSDGTGTFTVTVQDTTPPVVDLIGPAETTVRLGSRYRDAGAVGFDLVDGDLTRAIHTDDPVDTSVIGTYEVTHGVADAAGNQAVAVVRTVHVVPFCEGVPATLWSTRRVITGTEAADVIVGLGDGHVISGQGGDDLICGGPGDDTLIGGDGDDVLVGRGGNDRLVGGPGDDELRGGSGIDVADFSDAPGPVVVDLKAGTAQGEGTDAVSGIENLIGSSYGDTLRGDTRANAIRGGPGDDVIDGRGGDDLLEGGPGDDTIRGGTGRDTIRGGDGADRLVGGAGDDAVFGGLGDDHLAGGAGNDSLFGGGGDDLLDGGARRDHCDGGSDRDTARTCEEVVATESGQVPWPLLRPGPRQVALTFDDGPHAIYTAQVLDVLARYGVPATFFVMGHAAQARPALIGRMVAEGHSVQNHTYDHPYLTRYSNGAITDQLVRTNTVITRLTGATPHCMRPPFMAVNDRVRGVATGLGLATIMWDVDPYDWKRPGPSVVAQRVLRATTGGDVILLHDTVGPSTVGALPAIITGLRARGLEFVPLCVVPGLAP